jgi:hypothetical protein
VTAVVICRCDGPAYITATRGCRSSCGPTVSRDTGDLSPEDDGVVGVAARGVGRL